MSRETVAWVTEQPALSSAASSSCCVPRRRRSTRLATSLWRSALVSGCAACMGAAFPILPGMTTQADEARNGGLRGAVRKVAGHVSAIGRLEAELARSELKRKTRSLGIGLALGIGAALCGL